MRIKLCALLVFISLNVSATPEIQSWRTEQGARVLFVEATQLPMVDLQVLFHAGGSRNGDLPGLSSLTNQLLSQGADGLSADEISMGFESLGAVYGSSAGYDSDKVSLRSLSAKDKLQPALENLVRVLTRPDFPENAFERERNRKLIGLRSKKQNPGALASDAFYEALYRDHPYARPVSGTEETLNKITLDDIRAFHKKYYVAANAIIAIMGDLSRAEAEKIANQISSTLPRGEKAAPIPEVAMLNKANRVHIDHPSQQTHILIGQPGIKRGDPDYFALYVGNHILGGGGLVSRLFEEVRNKRGLSYSAYSYFSPMKQAGPFAAGLQTRADQAEEAINVLMDNLRKFIDEGPTEDEMVASKKNITGGFPLRIDSNGKILGYLAAIGMYDLPLDYLETFNSNIEAVTVEQIQQAFQRKLTPDNFVTVLVGPKPEQGENPES